MRTIYSILLSLVIVIPLLVSSPGLTSATTLTVSKSCDPSDTNCFATISNAISNANTTTNDNITIMPGTYVESITLNKDNLPISGVETAATVLQSPGSTPVITVSGLTNVTISKLTIVSTSASVGMQAANSGVNISNCIFWGGSQGTAIQLQGNSSGQIVNNTFFQNKTAISSQVDITVQNNIFSMNGTALSPVSPIVQFTKVSYNDFNQNTTIGFTYDTTSTLATNIPNGNNSSPDPKFVNATNPPPNMDVHLAEGSPCIGTGSGAVDIGAFGGSGADTIPFIISGVTLSSTPGSGIVSVSWSPNNSYNVTNTDPAKQGGYNVYYRPDQKSPRTKAPTVPSTSTSTVISGLTTTVAQPAAPVLNDLGFANETLFVSWSSVDGATSYQVHYTDTDIVSSVTNTIDVGSQTSATLSGLINGHHYLVTVSAIAQPFFFFSVTAFDNTVVSADGGNPGVSHESDYSTEKSIAVGTAVESLLSNPKTDFPEAITPFPDLPNNGCFIATAAYGHYSAPQVQALREFRDRYLMTNGPGRAFVEWYYRYGPIGADYLNTHPWLKPVVRTALMPAVGGALFMTRTSLPSKVAVLLLVGLLSWYLVLRKKFVKSGGVR